MVLFSVAHWQHCIFLHPIIGRVLCQRSPRLRFFVAGCSNCGTHLSKQDPEPGVRGCGAVSQFDHASLRTRALRESDVPYGAPVIISLLPGVLVGSYLLSIVHPDLVKIFLYVVLLPLILLQASGIRKPIKSELGFKLPFGLGLGLCYSLTTHFGPTLGVVLE